MKDIVEFLRSGAMQTPGCDCERCEAARKAADEIERLRQEPSAGVRQKLAAAKDAGFWIDALSAKVEALQRDAERYRWMRDHGDEEVNGVQLQITKHDKEGSVGLLYFAADAAIDAALAAKERR